jgi:hypothetical protein
MNTANCEIKFIGKNVVVENTYVLSMNIDTKQELSYEIKNTDGDKTIDLSNIKNLRMIFFHSVSPFKVKIAKDTDIIVFDVQDTFLFSLSDITTIDSVKISTDSTANQDIEVRIYGETS